MRSQFCQLTSALFASVCLVAMAVGLLAFASTALASDPIEIPLPNRECGECYDFPCEGVDGWCDFNIDAVCVNGERPALACIQCRCLMDFDAQKCYCAP